MLRRHCLVILFLLPSNVLAEGIIWSGFFNAAYLTSDNEKVYDQNVDNHANFSRGSSLGLNIYADLSDSIEFGGQFLAEGIDRNKEPRADWAFVTYRPLESLSLRFGRQKLPLWLASDYINVGMTYPWIEPPREVYALGPIKSFSGVSIQYALEFGDYSVSLEVYGGDSKSTLRGENETTYPLDGNEILGASLTLGNENAQLRLNQATGNINLPTFGINERPVTFQSVGINADWNNVLVMSEYATVEESHEAQKRSQAVASYDQQIAGAVAAGASPETLAQLGMLRAIQADKSFDHEAFYVTLGYRFGSFLPNITYASIKTPDNQILIGGDQTSMTLGTKVEVAETSAIKISYQKISVKEGKLGFFDRNPDGGIPDKTDGTGIFGFAFNTTF